MSISARDVFFSYENKLALENVSLDIQKNEFACIIGPNGGGKTSFLHLCAGYAKPRSGTLTIQTSRPFATGFVPQNIHRDRTFPITTLEIVLSAFIKQARPFGRYPRCCTEKALQTLTNLGLFPYKDVPFGDLSTGLAQRALLARAIVDDPEILLLDEPTSSVDPDARKTILDLIFSLKGSMTILFVTHDLEIAIKKMDKIFCIEKTVTCFSSKTLCKHFGVGLYHHKPFLSEEPS